MARSTYVYIVMARGQMTPEAAFTVKHELKTYLSNRDPVIRPPFLVYRLRDLGHGRAPQDTYVYTSAEDI